MATSVSELAAALKAAYDAQSVAGVNPEAARAAIATAQAAAIASFVIGRSTEIAGITVTGVALTGEGVVL